MRRRNLFHLVSRLWRLRERGWLTGSWLEHLRLHQGETRQKVMRNFKGKIMREKLEEDKQEERRGDMVRVNWLNGDMTMVLGSIEVPRRTIIGVTRRWKATKVNHGSKEVIKDMGRRGVIMISGQRGVVIKVIGLVMRDTSRTGMAVRNHGEITMT